MIETGKRATPPPQRESRNEEGEKMSTDGWRTASVGAALVCAGLLVALVVATKPAEAAFPGTNGKIVFVSNRTTLTNTTGDREIYTMDSNGMNVTQLTDNNAPDFSPAFSADGTKIAFVSQRDGGAEEIYVMDS